MVRWFIAFQSLMRLCPVFRACGLTFDIFNSTRIARSNFAMSGFCSSFRAWRSASTVFGLRDFGTHQSYRRFGRSASSAKEARGTYQDSCDCYGEN